MVSLFDLLRHEKQSRHGHENTASRHSDPPERADMIWIPEKNCRHGSARRDSAFEFKKDRSDREEVDADERINEAGTS